MVSDEVDKLRKLAQGINRLVPEETYGSDFVNPDMVRAELEELSGIKKTLRTMATLRKTHDIYREFGREAAKQLVIEMQTATYSSDRIKAAIEILNRAEGKPVDRIMNLHADVNQLSDQELHNETMKLLTELKIINEPYSNSVLLQGGQLEPGSTGTAPAETPPDQGGVGSEQVEER